MVAKYITVCVTGSRGIKSKIVVEQILYKFFEKYSQYIIHVIVGDAPGVDTITYNWAKKAVHFVTQLRPAHKYFPELWQSPADNVLYHARNMSAVNNCDVVLSIWDGKSTGTKHTMDYAEEDFIEVFVREC